MGTYKSDYISSAANTNRTPSPAIWGDCPFSELLRGEGGIAFHDDFVYLGKITAPTTEAALVGLNLSGFSDTGSQIVVSHEAGGAIQLKATENEATSLRSEVAAFKISANLGRFWCEGRIKLSHTATTENAWFFGLMNNVALSADVPITDTGALADQNLVGFHKPEANTTAFDFTYKANTVTAVEVKSDIGALVADTYIKLGFTFNERFDNKLRCYINGVQQTNDSTAKVIPDNTGTDFPADVLMNSVVALGVGAAASDNILTMDWWRFAQEIA